MANRFSFSTAEQLLAALQSAKETLFQKNNLLAQMFCQLAEYFRDSGYDAFQMSMRQAKNSSDQVLNMMESVILHITHYKEQLYQHCMESVMASIPFETISYENETVRFGAEGEALEHKNQQLEFQNEVRLRMKERRIPLAVKQAYAFVGAQCPVTNDEYAGTAHYHPYQQHIQMHLREDLDNPCGQLSTYFHEVGHAIDYHAGEDSCLSNDPQFRMNLLTDFENCILHIQHSYGCSVDDAYWHMTQKFAVDEDLFSDVSDVMGGLSQCKCQGLWGHSASYWAHDPQRVLREAFANMFSSAFGAPKRVEVMQQYFPSAYNRFLQLLEVFDDSN